jgi:N-methylhydantoinase A
VVERRRAQGDGLDAARPASSRPVCFDADEGYVDTPIHQRTDLVAGSVVEGPAILEEYGSTVPLHPGFAATVDDFGNLVVRRVR